MYCLQGSGGGILRRNGCSEGDRKRQVGAECVFRQELEEVGG